MADKDFLKNLQKIKDSAPMSEVEDVTVKKMKKEITIPVEWNDKIKNFHTGAAVTNYILIAVKERMQKDGLL